jgi:hypothetical protein
MKLALVTLLVLTGANAFAKDIDCSAGDNVENYISIAAKDDGSMIAAAGDLSLGLPPKSATVIEGTDFTDQPETKIYTATKVDAKSYQEGSETGSMKTSVVFVLNVKTMEGRLTLIVDGKSEARNSLVSCK